MDLQTRKLIVIENLIRLKDENTFSMLEKIINESMSREEKTYKPFTKQELIKRAKLSNVDYATGNFKDQEELEIESKQW